jgi:glutamine amidotransferase
VLFDGVEGEYFYFVHLVRRCSGFEFEVRDGEGPRMRPPQVTWAEHGARFVLRLSENGPLSATQFHPEKSGDARQPAAPQLAAHAVSRERARRGPML